MKIIRPMTVNDAALLSSNVLENDYADYNGGSTYALGDRTLYITSDKHWVIESLQNGNTGHIPTGLTSDTWWLLVGNDNRWKMFDSSITSQTSNLESIDVDILAAGRVDSVALLNVDAASVTVTMTDAVDGIVYNQTYSLVSDSGINDWYAYYFEPIVRLNDYTIADMPIYANPTIGVTITDTGATAYCGGLVLGLSKELGDTQLGLNLSITDYSVKTQDQFGNYEIQERAFRKKAEATIKVDNTFVDQLQQLLAGYRTTPLVWIGSENYGASIIYGFYKDFSTNIQYANHSICTVSIEGLT